MTGIRVTASDAVDRPLPVGGWAGRRAVEARGYTVSRVKRPGGGVVTVVSVHLPLEAGQRLEHARRVVAEIADDPELGRGPFVVGGDLNESVGGAAWTLLGERLRVATPERPTFPSAHPHSWIDAIFVSTELAVLPPAELDLDPAALRAASDHLPVWVDLEV